MARWKRSAIEIEPQRARWELAALSAFASWPIVTDGSDALVRPDAEDLPVQKALRELHGRHQAEPLPAVDAYTEAFEVLEAHDALREFATFRAGREGAGGYWPTVDSTVRRLRAV
jgi:hypothetical protein